LPTVREKISKGAGTDLAWDVILFGHHECNRYAPTYVVNGKVHNVIDDQKLFSDFLEDFKHLHIDRRDNLFKIALPFVKVGLKNPRWLARGLKYGASKLWNARKDLIQSRGQFHKLSFFIHNFMDADNLVCERVDTCSFMVMTEDGPMSMCAHNARRDEFITRPMTVKTENGEAIFDPLISRKIQDPSRQIQDAYLGKTHPKYKDADPTDHSCGGGCKS
jgi:7,8-dihydro-6-hydroxymethylpterin dimethyltransferase